MAHRTLSNKHHEIYSVHNNIRIPSMPDTPYDVQLSCLAEHVTITRHWCQRRLEERGHARSTSETIMLEFKRQGMVRAIYWSYRFQSSVSSNYAKRHKTKVRTT